MLAGRGLGSGLDLDVRVCSCLGSGDEERRNVDTS